MAKKIKFVINDIVNPITVDVEDGGQAKIFHADGIDTDESENGVFVRIQSWDENCIHANFNKLLGRKIKITIETVD